MVSPDFADREPDDDLWDGKTVEQLAWRDIETGSDSQDVVRPDTPLPALNLPQGGRLHAQNLSQRTRCSTGRRERTSRVVLSTPVQ